MAFKPGDVVQLQSGGPRMTIEKIEGQHVFCRWFKERETKQEAFDMAALKLAGAAIKTSGNP